MSSSELFPTAVNRALTNEQSSLSPPSSASSSTSSASSNCLKNNQINGIQHLNLQSITNNNKNVRVNFPQQKIAPSHQQIPITRPQSKIQANKGSPIKPQQPPKRRANTSLAKARNAQNNPTKNHPKKNFKGKISPMNKKTPKISKRTYEALDNPHSLPANIDELKKIITQLQALQHKHIDSSEFPEAQHVQRVIRSAENKLKNEESRKNSAVDVENTIVKKQELQAIVDKFVNDWKMHYDFFMNTTRKEIAALKKKQQEELEQYDQSEPKSLLPRYNKQSVSLIQMREKEKALALNRKFLAAEKMKNKADETEEEEQKQNIKIMLNDFAKKREKIVKKHKEQLRVFLVHAESTRIKMIQQKNQLLEGYIKRMNKIDGNIETLREEGKITDDELNNIQITQFREKAVTDSEYSFPIPRIRPGTSFLNARNGLVTVRPHEKHQENKSEEVNSMYQSFEEYAKDSFKLEEGYNRSSSTSEEDGGDEIYEEENESYYQINQSYQQGYTNEIEHEYHQSGRKLYSNEQIQYHCEEEDNLNEYDENYPKINDGGNPMSILKDSNESSHSSSDGIIYEENGLVDAVVFE